MIEAIPNISEGRDAAVIGDLERAVRSVPGVVWLGTAPDPDHNRTVFSWAAPDRETMRSAILVLYENALSAIDLRQHQGEHPRIGVIDVLPLVPLASTSLDVCIALAQDIGQEIAERFELPIFLYEYAAGKDYRRALPAIRSGGLDKLAEKMRTTEWQPDFGPDRPHVSAGVSVIGARRPLIAFNVQLASDDISIADEIARAVREISGGLPAVRALPIRLADRGIVQVSMNLLDYHRTSMWTAYKAVKSEAEARGVEVLSSELIGLAPAEAILEAAAEAMSLENFSMKLVLEHQLSEIDED